MVYTQPAGLRDREYNKFVAEQSAGSLTNVSVSNRVKLYSFPLGSLISSAGGAIDIYTDIPLNGELIAIQNKGADDPGSWVKVGSLTFTVSGTGETMYVWNSGTAIADTGIVDSTPKLNFPRAVNRGTSGSLLSSYSRIPMSNTYVRVVGAGLGNTKSGLGLNLVYQ